MACLTKTLSNLESKISPCQPELIDNFDPYNVFFGYCYKYTSATYDWFCGPGSHIYKQNLFRGGRWGGSLRAPYKLESPLVKKNIFLSLSLSLSLSELHTVHPTLHLRPTDVDGMSLHLCV